MNNNISKITSMTPFFAYHAYHPRTGAEPPGMYGDPLNHPQALAADQLVQRTRKIIEFL
jgi:hypothetical protein